MLGEADQQLPPAVILAAGESSRFWPLSTHGHKALHRLRGKAIIEHTVESLVDAGVTELIIVQSPIARAAHFPHRTVEDQLGDGRHYGVRITYVEQSVANGPGPSVQLALPFVPEWFFLLNPESINAGPIVRELWEARGDAIAVVAAEEKEETWLYGVFDVAANGRLRGVVEKPPRGSEPSRLCRTGIELLGPEFRAIHEREAIHEFSNIFALEKLARRRPVRVIRSRQPFFPLKYPWHLFAMAEYLGDGKPYIGPSAVVPDSVELDQDCVIEADAVLGKDIFLKGCLVGAGSRVESSLRSSILGAAVTIEQRVEVQSMVEVGTVKVEVKGSLVDSGLDELGVTIGQGTRVTEGTELAPGIMIGAESHVGPGRITQNVGDRLA